MFSNVLAFRTLHHVVETVLQFAFKRQVVEGLKIVLLFYVDSQEVYEVTQQRSRNVKRMKECDSIFLLPQARSC